MAAALFEAAFLASFVALADFGNRTHVLIFLASTAVYGIVLLGLFALGARLDRWGERMLKAIELLDATTPRS